MGKKVMIVHSADKMKQMAETVLAENGYELAAFTHMGKQCVDLYRRTKPDMVILDAFFEDGTDYEEILPALRKEDPSVKVVMCAELADGVRDAVLMNMIIKGAKDFQPWPCTPEELLGRVKVWCDK